MPLSAVAVAKLKGRDRPYKKYDAGGLFVQVMPTGARWWRLKYRYAGKTKLLSLGVYPDVTWQKRAIGATSTEGAGERY
jgi:hypothetical protein